MYQLILWNEGCIIIYAAAAAYKKNKDKTKREKGNSSKSAWNLIPPKEPGPPWKCTVAHKSSDEGGLMGSYGPLWRDGGSRTRLAGTHLSDDPWEMKAKRYRPPALHFQWLQRGVERGEGGTVAEYDGGDFASCGSKTNFLTSLLTSWNLNCAWWIESWPEGEKDQRVHPIKERR